MVFNRCFPLFLVGVMAMGAGTYAASAHAQSETGFKQNEKQRQAFVDAKEALRHDRLDEFGKLSAQLSDYPLYPYLRYEYLRPRLGRVEPREIKLFLARYADTPLAPRLRRAWLYSLANRQQWLQYLAAYHETSSTRLRCHYANAKLQTGRTEGLWDLTRELWLVGKSQPDACDPVFEAWHRSGKMTRDDVVERIALAMDKRRMGLVHYLARFLPAADRKWIDRGRKMHARPERELAKLKSEPAQAEWAARLFAYGVRRIASRDPVKADRIWNARRSEFELTEKQVARTGRAIALNLAFARHPMAAKRLAQLGQSVSDDAVRHWRVRAALWQEDWKEVLAALDALPKQEQSEAEWTYWRARALGALGDDEQAKASLASAARCRCYYGFLAAEHAGLPPAIDTAPIQVDDKALAQMASTPAMVRARELLALELDRDARREWWWATRSMGQGQLRIAAKLADTWGWHDRAILTLGRTDSLDDLELRFPTPYVQQVKQAAAKRELDTAFVYSVMRQESAFNARARSHAGALGLMQLMPATARRTARYISRPAPRTAELLTPERNIQLGTAHLRQLLDEYDGNLVYTMAAYNAGPHRVSRWRPKHRAVPADIWVESMPFRETRNYVKRILAYIRIYQWRLGRDLTPMSDDLRAVGTPAADAVADSDADGRRQAG
jgi:soluble lytic murein transglycosylase